MIDMTKTIKPKSNQLNADDLVGDTMTIKVTKVSILGEAEQPIGINFEGDNDKPYKPCKSMRRVMVNVWGKDGNAYVGRSMTLYRDDTVMFGGAAVGGIRISHMSHIEKPVTMALTATRANRKPYTVKPLTTTAAVAVSKPIMDAEILKSILDASMPLGPDALKNTWLAMTPEQQDLVREHKDKLKQQQGVE